MEEACDMRLFCIWSKHVQKAIKPSLRYQLVQVVVRGFDVAFVQYPAGPQRSTQLSHQLASPWYGLLTMF
jgi:hypothetical protein